MRSLRAKRLAVLVFLATVAPLLPTIARDQEVTEAERIRRVESELVPITAARGKPGAYAKLRDRMRDLGVAGLSVAVIDNGKIAWAKGYGVADAAERRPVTTKTRFQAASISKPVAALGALMLVERGKVDLDTDINQYLHSWKVPSNQMTDSHPVTLRTLLDLSAGFADADFSSSARSESLLKALASASPPVHLESVPGSKYRYSGMPFVVLQVLLEDVTARPFPAFMQSAVLHPLGMTASTFEAHLPTPLRSSAAKGYYAGGEPVPGGGYTVGPELAVAGLWTTPSDLARFVIELQRDYAGKHPGRLSSKMAKQMLSPQIEYRGLGVVLSERGEDMRFGHDGFNEGFESALVGYVERGQGAVVMANSGFSYMLIKEVLASIARVYRWPSYELTNQWPPAAAISQQEVSAIPAEILAAAAGRYALDQDHSIDIVARGAKLMLHWPGNGDAEIFGTPDGTYFCPQLTFSDFGDPNLRFELGTQGKVERIIAAYGHWPLVRTSGPSVSQ